MSDCCGFCLEESDYEVGDRVIFVDGSDLDGTEGTIIEIDPESGGAAFFVQSDIKCCPVFATVMDVAPA